MIKARLSLPRQQILQVSIFLIDKITEYMDVFVGSIRFSANGVYLYSGNNFRRPCAASTPSLIPDVVSWSVIDDVRELDAYSMLNQLFRDQSNT